MIESMRLISKSIYLALRYLIRAVVKIPGGLRVVYAIRRAWPRPKGYIKILDFDGNLTMYVRLDEHMQSQIFWQGYYSRGFAPLLDRILLPGMQVIDAGANVGEITLLAAKRVGLAGRVIAFEPVPEIAACLCTNIEANEFSQVTVVKAALSEDEGEHELYRRVSPIKDRSVNDGTGSLFQGNRGRRGTGSVRVGTLDTFVKDINLSKVDLIKMDIEGAELPALRGASELLARDRPMLIVEVQEESANAAGYGIADLFEFLSQYGYAFETILDDGNTRPTNLDNLEPIQNVFCRPPGTRRRV